MTDLHPDLKQYVGNTTMFATLTHPLIYAVPYDPSLNDYLNKAYAAKRHRVEQLTEDENWHALVFTYERPYRASVLDMISGYMEDDDRWKLTAAVWIDSENIRELHDTWVGLWSNGDSHMAMSEDDLAAYTALPDEVTVYRGYSSEEDNGISWTLDKNTATWFANRFGITGKVKEKTVNKADILALFTQRGEMEVVLLP